MSIPRRIWRILVGRLNNLTEAVTTDPGEQTLLREAELLARAKAEAARELAEATGRGPFADHRPTTEARRPTMEERRLGSRPPMPGTGSVASGAQRSDPLAGCYQLLKLVPGSDLAALEVAMRARLAEVDPARHPEGSQERFVAESRARAIVNAYEKLRDALHPTETRFEKLEL